jgi:hypothetical protein
MEGEKNKRGVDKMLVNTSSSYKDKMKEQQKKIDQSITYRYFFLKSSSMMMVILSSQVQLRVQLRAQEARWSGHACHQNT